MTGSRTSSESHTKVVGRGSSTHDFFSRFLNKIVDVLFTQIPEGTQYYIRVDHRFSRRNEIMTIRLTDRCSINLIANVLHLSNKIPADIVRDYGLVKVLGKQGFILHVISQKPPPV